MYSLIVTAKMNGVEPPFAKSLIGLKLFDDEHIARKNSVVAAWPIASRSFDPNVAGV